MVLTDTHTHFYYERDMAKREAMLQRCLDNKVSRLFLPNVDAESVELIWQLTEAYPQYFFAMLGLHPCDVKPGWEAQLEKIKQGLLPGKKIYAVGEIGIDLYWDKTTLAEQVKAFEQQIAWANELDLPIVIHCRNAFDEVFEVLQRNKTEKLRGIFHCFSGTEEQAHQTIGLGFYLGIGGVVTYKNSGLDKVVENISLDYIVLETDAPYLTPVPYRGKPNESSYLKFVAEKIADLHHTDTETVARITTENSVRIFGV
ncbi:TatD family hydrolase [Mucilaginibacter sp. RS28]|uniref:TatD family hydrolase n=1 Tax=Mucilaginibacter straminoryzae TaxID=2932774 RepID=A0A9X1X740_9SPHI|nr:TatD family hydrolase [Mucilaginibacter straminoryzae]MCJ8211375.1 TatD family hydrolase [Mucilaginibacter straminoryzae]